MENGFWKFLEKYGSSKIWEKKLMMALARKHPAKNIVDDWNFEDGYLKGVKLGKYY
jgi:hypothetical protein